MHLIKSTEVSHSEVKLTLAVLQITQMLGIYHAELARILRLQCADIGELSSAKIKIKKHTNTWFQAIKYVEMYEHLFYFCEGNEAKMNNWLRKKNKKLQSVPLYQMVDELEISQVIDVLKTQR